LIGLRYEPARQPHGLPLVERLAQANTPATRQIALRSTESICWCNGDNDSVNRAYWGFATGCETCYHVIMARPLKGDSASTGLDRMRDTRRNRNENGMRRVELWLPPHVLSVLDELAKQQKKTRAGVVADLAIGGLHKTENKKGLVTNVKNSRVFAVHEIGHAVAAARFGFGFGYVTILPTMTSGGHVAFTLKSRQAFPSRESIRKRVFVLVAGEAAQRVFFSAEDDLHRSAGNRDRESAHEELETFLRMQDADDRERFIEAELQRAIAWIKSDVIFYCINKLAELLVSESTLQSSKVKSVYTEGKRLFQR